MIQDCQKCDELEEQLRRLVLRTNPDQPFLGPRLTRQELRALRALYTVSPAWLPFESLIEFIYYDVEEPLAARKSIHVLVFRLRKKLGPIGVEIKSSHSFGYCIPVESKAVLQARDPLKEQIQQVQT